MWVTGFERNSPNQIGNQVQLWDNSSEEENIVSKLKQKESLLRTLFAGGNNRVVTKLKEVHCDELDDWHGKCQKKMTK